MASIHLNKSSSYGLLLVLLVLAVFSLVFLIGTVLQSVQPEILIGDPGSNRSFLLVFERVDTLLEQLETEKAILYPNDPHLNLVDQYS